MLHQIKILRRRRKKRNYQKTKVNRGAIAQISLDAIAHNLYTLNKIVKGLPLIAVVKADAYGHGAVAVSKKITAEGTPLLAVAFVSEAVQLRKAGIHVPILVLFDRQNLEECFDFQLIPVISDIRTAESLSRIARKRNTEIPVHIKIDTGMGRLGFYGKNVLRELLTISELEGVRIDGMLSHFSEADLADRSYASTQLEHFIALRRVLVKKTKKRIFTHIANSSAVLAFRESYLDAVRPGIALYGYSPLQEKQKQLKDISKFGKTNTRGTTELVPAMTVKTKILALRSVPKGMPISYGRTFVTTKKSKIAVIPLGYADGYSRLFSNNAEVLVGGKRAPVVGRVCMDLTMIDVSAVRNCRENDEVIIMGQQGKDTITAYELAIKADTIPYEILTTLGNRSQRVYV
jgi:alanine racemase